MDNQKVIVVKELRAIVDKIERLEGQKAGIGSDIKDTYDEEKSRGFDKKVLRRLVKERKEDRDALKLEQELLELYRDALEMPGFEAACEEAEEQHSGQPCRAEAERKRKAGAGVIKNNHLKQGQSNTSQQAEPSPQPSPTGRGSFDGYKVISLAKKTIDCLAQIQKQGGEFKPINKSDMKLAERFSEMGYLEAMKGKDMWKLTAFGAAQVPAEVV